MRFENLSDAQILEAIRHPEDSKGNTDIHTVEGAILQNNSYRWYYGLARVFKPMVIAEIGVRFGYSLFALAAGAHLDVDAYGWDNESYITGSLDWARSKLEPICDALKLVKANSQELQELDCGDFDVDIFSVDGDHSDAGARHDMDLAWECLQGGGLLLVDDIDYAGRDGKINLRPVVARFCEEKQTDFLYLPTTRGLAVIQKAI